jgi:hypothetical protein
LDAGEVKKQLEGLSNDVSDRAEALAEGVIEPPDSDERLVGHCRLTSVLNLECAYFQRFEARIR